MSNSQFKFKDWKGFPHSEYDSIEQLYHIIR